MVFHWVNGDFLIMNQICVARVPASRVHGVSEKEHSRSGPEVGHQDNCIQEMEMEMESLAGWW